MTDQLIEGPHAARSTLDGSPFPAIADYGFLSDYYAALCRHLEAELMVGRRRESKFAATR